MDSSFSNCRGSLSVLSSIVSWSFPLCQMDLIYFDLYKLTVQTIFDLELAFFLRFCSSTQDLRLKLWESKIKIEVISIILSFHPLPSTLT